MLLRALVPHYNLKLRTRYIETQNNLISYLKNDFLKLRIWRVIPNTNTRWHRNVGNRRSMISIIWQTLHMQWVLNTQLEEEAVKQRQMEAELPCNCSWFKELRHACLCVSVCVCASITVMCGMLNMRMACGWSCQPETGSCCVMSGRHSKCQEKWLKLFPWIGTWIAIFAKWSDFKCQKLLFLFAMTSHYEKRNFLPGRLIDSELDSQRRLNNQQSQTVRVGKKWGFSWFIAIC